jgi:hypothetical protein
MDQRSICLFFATKRLSAQAPSNELVAVLGPNAIGYSTVTNYLHQRHFFSPLRETIAWNPLGFPLIAALPKGRTCNTEYYRDKIFTALTQFQPEDDGRKKLSFMLTMQGLTPLNNVELFVKKMDCGSLSIHLTHLISYYPTSFCSVMSRNVSKEWYFHHTSNYSRQLVKW